MHMMKKINLLFSVIFIAGVVSAQPATSSDVDNLLSARVCIDKFSTRVFLDGATVNESVPVALVQCSDIIGLYVNGVIQSVERKTKTPLEDKNISQITAKLIFELHSWQINHLSGGQGIN